MSDMNELFNRDPLDLTKKDITLIVQEYRKRAHLYAKAPQSSTGKPKSEKAQQVAKLDLGGLSI